MESVENAPSKKNSAPLSRGCGDADNQNISTGEDLYNDSGVGDLEDAVDSDTQVIE